MNRPAGAPGPPAGAPGRSAGPSGRAAGASASGPSDRSGRPEVLFMCVHNAGRSQMAAALLERYGAGRVVVRSAGSAPAEEVNPAVVDAMAEVGIDISKEVPKALTEAAARAADVVVTMGCGDACPYYPGKRYLDWQVDDPAGKTLEEVRAIRDEIDRRVRALVAELLAWEGPVEPAVAP